MAYKGKCNEKRVFFNEKSFMFLKKSSETIGNCEVLVMGIQ